MKLRIFNGRSLSTRHYTEITGFKPSEVETDSLESNILCCPTVLNTTLNIYPICNNSTCMKELNVPAGAKIITCGLCQRKILNRNTTVDVNASPQIDTTEKEINNIIIFPSELKKIFGQDCIAGALDKSDGLAL